MAPHAGLTARSFKIILLLPAMMTLLAVHESSWALGAMAITQVIMIVVSRVLTVRALRKERE